MIKNIMRDNKLLEIILLGILSSIILNWFKGDFYIKTIDSVFGFNPVSQAYTSYYIWKDYYSFGYPLPNIALFIVYKFQQSLGDLIFSQKVIFYIIFFCSMLSMWFFLKEIFQDNSVVMSFARISGSIFYSMNIFTLSWIWWRQMLWMFFWSSVPLILLFLFKTLKSRSKKESFKYTIIASVILSISSFGYSLLSILTLLIATVWILSYFLYISRNRIDILNKYLIFLFLLLITNAWFILPQVLTIEQNYTYVEALSIDPPQKYLEAASRFTTMSNVIRLWGTYLMYEKHGGDSYYSWTDRYISNRFFYTFSFIIPLLAFGSIFFLKRETNKKIKSLIIVGLLTSILMIFLMKGASFPFKEINIFLTYLPLGSIFRHPYDRFAFILVINYTILISYSIFKILYQKNIILNIICISLVMIMLTIYVYPFYNGDVIFGGGKIIASDRVKIPSYYYDMENYFKDKGNPRILILPISYWGEASYKWANGIHPNGDPIDSYFIPNASIIQFNTGMQSDKILSMLYYYFSKGDIKRFNKLLSLGSINYIILHNDWDGSYSIRQTIFPEVWKKKLTKKDQSAENKDNIYLINSFGKLGVFKVKNYRDIIYIDNNPKQILFENLSKENLDLIKIDSTSKVQYTKINPTIYKIKANITKPSMIALAESYDPLWTAYVEKINGKPIKQEKINPIALYSVFNGFWIKDKGDLDIIIKYEPQTWLEIGLVGSMVTFIIFIGYIVYDNRK